MGGRPVGAGGSFLATEWKWRKFVRRLARRACAGEGRAECVAEFLGDALAAEPRAGAAMKRSVAVSGIWFGADDDDPFERERWGQLAANRSEVGGVDNHEVWVGQGSVVEFGQGVDR